MTKKMFAIAFAAMLLLLMGCNPGTSGNGNGGTTNGNGTTTGKVPPQLIGKWEQDGKNMGFEFKSNGELYQWSGTDYYQLAGVITWWSATQYKVKQGEGGTAVTITWDYELSGDTLTLSMGGGGVSYTMKKI